MGKKWMNVLAVTGIGLLVAAAGCSNARKSAAVMPDKAPSEPNYVLKTPVDQMSYSYGVETAKGLKNQEIDFNPDAMNQGMKDYMAGKLQMSKSDLRYMLMAFQSQVRAKQVQSRMYVGRDNMKKGEIFLMENKTKEGVVTLPSGLQYKILKEGAGPKPTDTDVVQCYYTGTLLDGTEFDSSAHGQDEGEAVMEPAIVTLSDVIPGWREALKLMPVGSKWQLFIPSNLAYGQKPSGRLIGPNATLIYEVELVGIK